MMEAHFTKMVEAFTLHYGYGLPLLFPGVHLCSGSIYKMPEYYWVVEAGKPFNLTAYIFT